MNKGKKVKFSARTRSGVGVIVDIHKTAKGDFFEVKPDDGSKNIKVRAAQIQAA